MGCSFVSASASLAFFFVPHTKGWGPWLLWLWLPPCVHVCAFQSYWAKVPLSVRSQSHSTSVCSHKVRRKCPASHLSWDGALLLGGAGLWRLLWKDSLPCLLCRSLLCGMFEISTHTLLCHWTLLFHAEVTELKVVVVGLGSPSGFSLIMFPFQITEVHPRA